MSFFSSVKTLFSKIGGYVWQAVRSAELRGLTDELLLKAYGHVVEASHRFTDNAEKREWAVQQLIAKTKVSESIARIAVELAVIEYYKALNKLDPSK